jgi:hypothetical protein
MKRVFILCALIHLVSCTSNLPLAKDSPLEASQNALVRPPWEAYVKAGPGAENDVDLETLNGPQVAASQPIESPPLETPVQPAPPVEQQPTPTPAVKQQPAPAPKSGSVQIKAVALLPVVGGNAKGNTELTVAMRNVLTQAGWEVLAKPRKDALSIQGRVAVDPALAGKQMVHLQWLVSTPAGKNLGDIKQDNAVPDGSLNAGWGENAGFAAQGAAEGIFKLIEKFR